MNYIAIINGKEHVMDIEEEDGGIYRLSCDGRSFRVDAHWLSEGQLSILQGDEHYCVNIERTDECALELAVRGEHIAVEVLDLRTKRLREASALSTLSGGPLELRAPMPGKVVAVLVSEGSEVQEGEGIAVIEAMKMENEVKAPRQGVVRGLALCEGEAVDGNTLICRLD